MRAVLWATGPDGTTINRFDTPIRLEPGQQWTLPVIVTLKRPLTPDLSQMIGFQVTIIEDEANP